MRYARACTYLLWLASLLGSATYAWFGEPVASSVWGSTGFLILTALYLTAKSECTHTVAFHVSALPHAEGLPLDERIRNGL